MTISRANISHQISKGPKKTGKIKTGKDKKGKK